MFWRETGTKEEVVDEVDAREGACNIETAMSRVAETAGCNQSWRRKGRVVGGCTSRGAWATVQVNTQVRVLLCADSSDTRRRGALFRRTSG